jgi:hypothetical protein
MCSGFRNIYVQAHILLGLKTLKSVQNWRIQISKFTIAPEQGLPESTYLFHILSKTRIQFP